MLTALGSHNRGQPEKPPSKCNVQDCGTKRHQITMFHFQVKVLSSAMCSSEIVTEFATRGNPIRRSSLSDQSKWRTLLCCQVTQLFTTSFPYMYHLRVGSEHICEIILARLGYIEIRERLTISLKILRHFLPTKANHSCLVRNVKGGSTVGPTYRELWRYDEDMLVQKDHLDESPITPSAFFLIIPVPSWTSIWLYEIWCYKW